MYFQQAEHNPPHIHAIYHDDMAAIDIQNGSVMEGYFPSKALAMVREWVLLHNTELLTMWETQQFKALDPLE